MAQAVFGSPIRRVYGETVSLTTTATHLALRPGYKEVMFYCASDWRMGIAPGLQRVFLYEATGGTYTDVTANVTDRSSSTHAGLDAMAATGILYMGFDNYCPRGVYFDVGSNVNAEAATLDVEYWNGSAWTDVAGDSDGSDNGGATLAQDGLYTWTLPASATTTVNGVPNLHWIRFKPSAALSATVDLDEIIPACADTNYAYMNGGVVYQFSFNTVRDGAFEFDHAATDTLYVNWIDH